MTNHTFKAFAALALVGSTSVLSLAAAPAKADLFCLPWESNCKVDGRIGTSGNDILGLPGGDTITKLGMGADAYFGTGGAISGAVKTYYQPYKRQILDAVGNELGVNGGGMPQAGGGYYPQAPGQYPQFGGGYPQAGGGYPQFGGGGYYPQAQHMPIRSYAPAPYQPNF